MTDIDGLIERLERSVVVDDGHGFHMAVWSNPDGPEAAAALSSLKEKVKGLDAHLFSIRSRDGSCPQCSDTKRDCSNIIAEMEVDYRTALKGGPHD